MSYNCFAEKVTKGPKRHVQCTPHAWDSTLKFISCKQDMSEVIFLKRQFCLKYSLVYNIKISGSNSENWVWYKVKKPGCPNVTISGCMGRVTISHALDHLPTRCRCLHHCPRSLPPTHSTPPPWAWYSSYSSIAALIRLLCWAVAFCCFTCSESAW